MGVKENIYSKLKKDGYRITRQKEAILNVLADNMNRMMSVTDILNKLPDNLNVDSATVYRNVQKLSELGILESMVDDEGISRYVIDADKDHHHHMICIACGRIIDIPCKNNYWSECAKDNGFEEMFHKLEVYGKCNICKKYSETVDSKK